MKIKALYRRFRDWQINPFRYQDHSDHVERCANCGTEFQSNFCPVCGQKAGVGPIGWKSVHQGLMVVWGMDSRSLGFSILQLILRPGYLISDYISGKRLSSFPPVKMLLLVAIGMMMVEALFGEPSESKPEVITTSFDHFSNWAENNTGWALMAISSLFLLPTWLQFRYAPKNRKHTLPEGFFIQVFMATMFAFIGIISIFFDHWWVILLWPLFYLITYRQLFGYSWWGTLWRLFVCGWGAMATAINLNALGNHLLHLGAGDTEKLLYVNGMTAFFVLIGTLIEFRKKNRTKQAL